MFLANVISLHRYVQGEELYRFVFLNLEFELQPPLIPFKGTLK